MSTSVDLIQKLQRAVNVCETGPILISSIYMQHLPGPSKGRGNPQGKGKASGGNPAGCTETTWYDDVPTRLHTERHSVLISMASNKHWDFVDQRKIFPYNFWLAFIFHCL